MSHLTQKVCCCCGWLPCCYLRGVNCYSGLQLFLFIASDYSPMVPSGLTALAADLVVILHFSAARVSLPTYSLKTAAMINCNNAWIASAPSLFVAESILHRAEALAIIEWKQTHSLGLAIPWDISRHNPRASLLGVCSVFSICTWHRMLEQCTEETSSSRLDYGEPSVHYGNPGRHYPHVLKKLFLLSSMAAEAFSWVGYG